MSATLKYVILGWGLLGVAGLLMFLASAGQAPDPAAFCQDALELPPVPIAAGTYQIGDGALYPDEGPVREVRITAYRISATEVTVGQFAAFVEATGYRTKAERGLSAAEAPGMPPDLRAPGGAVFKDSSWSYVAGASWRQPDGPGAPAQPDEPVTQIALEDAQAYAVWAGGRLPTEAEWEVAARGGLVGQRYAWGPELNPDETWRANVWQGMFPILNNAEDGFVGRAPVGCFVPNRYGAYDMIGNVWEWTAEPYQGEAARGLIKGGSFLCASSYCRRYRPAARHPQEINLGTNHIGFRVVFPEADASSE